jgi:hypothetical protein
VSEAGANKQSWNDADFEAMGWHDCTIHALRFDQDGQYQSDLVLDLDYIFEWLLTPAGSYNFRVAPALLRFQNVDNLRIRMALRFKQTAQINEVTRSASHWLIGFRGYPNQEISGIEFDATGYIQELSRSPIVVSRQCLTWSERQPT